MLQTKRSGIHDDRYTREPMRPGPGIVARPRGHLVDRAPIGNHVYLVSVDSPGVKLVDELFGDGDDGRRTARNMALNAAGQPAYNTAQPAMPFTGYRPD